MGVSVSKSGSLRSGAGVSHNLTGKVEHWVVCWSSEVSRCPAVLSPRAAGGDASAQLNFEATRVAHELDGERL